jgi:hypothetical protein
MKDFDFWMRGVVVATSRVFNGQGKIRDFVYD